MSRSTRIAVAFADGHGYYDAMADNIETLIANYCADPRVTCSWIQIIPAGDEALGAFLRFDGVTDDEQHERTASGEGMAAQE